MKILLVDDDEELLDVTSYALRREGFNVISANSGKQALSRWESDHPDLVVLDVRLPQPDGFEVCRRIRQASTTPVILLTGLREEDEVTRGFRAGADDYVTKPFSTRQLALRIRAIWRRVAEAGAPEPAREVRVGNVTLDLDAHEVHCNGTLVQLTPLEFRLLHILASNPRRVISGTRLIEFAWGYDGDGDAALIRTHVSHIRKKLKAAGAVGLEISSLRGVGYRLAPSEAASLIDPLSSLNPFSAASPR